LKKFTFSNSRRRSRSYSSSNSDDSLDHRRNNKRSRKLDEVERLADIERLRKQREIEEKVYKQIETSRKGFSANFLNIVFLTDCGGGITKKNRIIN